MFPSRGLILRKIVFLTAMTSAMVLFFLGSTANFVEMEKRKQKIFFEEHSKSKIDAASPFYLSPSARITSTQNTVKSTTLQQITNPTTTEIITNDDSLNEVEVKAEEYKSRTIECDELKSILKEVKKKPTTTFRRENKYGNRGIYFARTKLNSPIVIKVATIQNQSDPIEIYRYNSALREIRILKDLQFKFTGIPEFWGSCVHPDRVIYAVERFEESEPLCKGNGTDMSCAMAQNIIEKIKMSRNAGMLALTFLVKATCFFSQFERQRIFMEDFSGSNFHFHRETFDFFLVDADSLIFYENAPLLSRMSCRTNSDCPKPSGNLWPSHALNRKIYYGCGEMYGICRNNTCQGIGSELHTCGAGRWLVTAVRSLIPVQVYNDYRKLRECMSESDPLKRCTAEYSCSASRLLLDKYKEMVK